MQLRSGYVVSAQPGAPPEPCRALFEEGVSLILKSWTALALAVEHEWGGSGSSQKADQLRADIIEWFYNGREHWADELEEAIDEVMTTDFNAQIEDGSQTEVADKLVQLHAELKAGKLDLYHRIKATAEQAMQAARRSQRQVVDNDGAVMEGESSDSDSDSEMAGSGDEGMMDAEGDGAAAATGPVVDDEGFELVQRRGRRGRR